MSDWHAGLHALVAQGVDVRRLVSDSRRLRAGDVFVAVPGGRHDPRTNIGDAVAAGAAAVIFESDGFAWRPEWRVPHLAVNGLRTVLGALASEALSHPSRQLWMAGVTGTNGKTSCSHWLAQCLTKLGRPTALIGTLGNGFPGQLEEATHTTPDVVSLHVMLADYATRGAQAAAMEVSSHGLDQGRVEGVHFKAALFTNLTRDHLDYHGDMQQYGNAKRTLFQWPTLEYAVVNLDDDFGADLAASLDRQRLSVMGYGIRKGDIAAHRLDLSRHGLRLEIQTPWGRSELESRLIGEFNASNLLGVLGMLLAAGVRLPEAMHALAEVDPVAGRLQVVREASGPMVVVDYAHTPDALEKVLLTLTHIKPSSSRLICVFGCGGDRDPGKRPLMGEIATRLADEVHITSDNPRSEPPRRIMDDIAAGAGANHRIQEDRALAIREAIQGADSNDIVLIAGKGHETYQEIAGKRYPFDDVAVARVSLRERHV